jgi:hypothetical protein
MAYFLIKAGPDGISICQLDHTEVSKRVDEMAGTEFMGSIPDLDPNYWGMGAIIIKGEIVVPQAKEVVLTWKVP